MDTILGKPIEEILKPLPIAPAVSHALIYNKGPLAPYLELVLAYEEGHINAMTRPADILKIDDGTVVRCYLDAVKWVDGGSAAAAG